MKKLFIVEYFDGYSWHDSNLQFNSFLEALCVTDMVFDEAGNPSDYINIKVNESYYDNCDENYV